MKGLAIVLFINILSLAQCELDLKALEKMAELLEKNGKLTPESIQPFTAVDINKKTKEATLAYIEHCKKVYLVNGGLSVPEWNVSKDMREAQSYVRAHFHKAKIENLDSLRFHNLTADLMNLTAKYGAYFEKEIHLYGHYNLHGEFIGQKITGKGLFDISLKGLKVAGITMGSVQDKHPLIISMESSIDMEDININITGLKIENFSEEELTTLLNSAALIYVKQYQDMITKLGAPVVIEHLNTLIKDMTVTQLYSIVQRSLEGI